MSPSQRAMSLITLSSVYFSFLFVRKGIFALRSSSLPEQKMLQDLTHHSCQITILMEDHLGFWWGNSGGEGGYFGLLYQALNFQRDRQSPAFLTLEQNRNMTCRSQLNFRSLSKNNKGTHYHKDSIAFSTGTGLDASHLKKVICLHTAITAHTLVWEFYMLNIFGVGPIHLKIFSQFTITKLYSFIKTICLYDNYFKVNNFNFSFLNK